MPPRPKSKAKSKKELLNEQIAAAVGAGREVAVETVDFSDPNRPKTCLEVDFPIIPINQIAAIEGNAGKPIYQMSKWWARRRSSVFRSLLLAAAMKAPEDESKAAKAVWEVYYANHQKRGALRHLKVVEPFMGGGTTIVEGSRLGMQMWGCDLNPVAWFIVKNEMAQVDLAEVKRLLADIEAEVKPMIMPYFACDGPDGEKGVWFRRIGDRQRGPEVVQGDLLLEGSTPAAAAEAEWEALPADFDIFDVPWAERKQYRYEGPEIIYTFWAKHGPCQRAGCGHRTPIMSSPVVAIKTLTVDAWKTVCPACQKPFDIERHAARMAPDEPLFVAPDEPAFAVMDREGRYACPHCGHARQDAKAFRENHSSELGKPANKKVELSLLIQPEWLEGAPKTDEHGREYGGSATDSAESTIRWNIARRTKLGSLLEVRGKLPELIRSPQTESWFYTNQQGGTSKRKGVFTCGAKTCGTEQKSLHSIEVSGKSAPWACHTIQGYSNERDSLGLPYKGRFFARFKPECFNFALLEWEQRKNSDLADFWPVSLIPFGHMANERNPLERHGISRWHQFFNPRQLLIHASILKAIAQNEAAGILAKEAVLGAFQQYLRNNNMFCIWNTQADKLEPLFSENNFNPKNNITENSVFGELGRGNWLACAAGITEAFAWAISPWEVSAATSHPSAIEFSGSKSIRISTLDPAICGGYLGCHSATDLPLPAQSFDLCITDPPFGGLLHYSELSDYFYVWLRLVLKRKYPESFGADYVPKALEAVANPARNPEDFDVFYQRILTASWKEAHRVLKPAGILAFTFHHSEDEPWVGVLESLFDAGFYLEATYPIRSDETKGEGEFGSKQIEYDIIHVCRKRLTTPPPISWARLRRQIVEDVRRLKDLLSQHQKEGLPAADLQVIRRGKALEYFSRHYGQVFIEKDRPFTIREALAGINTLLEDDEAGPTLGGEAPPANAEPYTRQFFRLFRDTTEVPRDQMQKFLRGTGIAPGDFADRGWCAEKSKVFNQTPPLELAREWKGASRKDMGRDFDQTMFLVGACFEGSGIRVEDTLNSPNFAPHPATGDLVDWLCRHGGSPEIKFAAQRARTIYREWLSKNERKVEEQMRLFDLEG